MRVRKRTPVYLTRACMLLVATYCLAVASVDLLNFFFRTVNSLFKTTFSRITIISEAGLTPLYYYAPGLLVILLWFIMADHEKDKNIKAIGVAAAVIPFAISLWFRIPTV